VVYVVFYIGILQNTKESIEKWKIKSFETSDCEKSMKWQINITKVTDITDQYEDILSQIYNFIT